jgi:hypothetical protein
MLCILSLCVSYDHKHKYLLLKNEIDRYRPFSSSDKSIHHTPSVVWRMWTRVGEDETARVYKAGLQGEWRSVWHLMKIMNMIIKRTSHSQ